MKKLPVRILILMLPLLAPSCTRTYDEPLFGNDTEQLTPTMTIQEFKSLYRGAALEIEDEVILEGTVTANDNTGNHDGCLFIQDATSGLKIMLGARGMADDYPIGRKIWIKARYLWLGQTEGFVALGYRDPAGLEEITWIRDRTLIANTVVKGPDGTPVVPESVSSAAQLTEDMLGTLVTVEGARYLGNNPEYGYLSEFVDDAGNTVQVDTVTTWGLPAYAEQYGRNIKINSGFALQPFEAGGQQVVLVRTSGNALFAGTPVLRSVPGAQSRVSITGIYVKRYGSKALIINSPEELEVTWRQTQLRPVENSLRIITRVAGGNETGLFPIMLEQSFLVPDPNQTNTTNWRIGGTDLGVMWEMGNGKTGIFFGDTFQLNFAMVNGECTGGYWGPNVLAFSSNTDIDERGVVIDDMVWSDAVQRWPNGSPIRTTDNLRHEIVTSAIRVNGTDYAHFMNVQQFGPWINKFSGMAKSTDDGQTWTVMTQMHFSSESKFSQTALAKDATHLYMYGTKSGRLSDCYLARTLLSEVEDLTKYEYYTVDETWVKNDESAAYPVFAGSVGEISVFYFSKFGKWIAAYIDESCGIVMRYADRPEGPWSDKKVLIRTKQPDTGSIPAGEGGGTRVFGGGYGSFIHPYKTDDKYLYMNFSVWGNYSVYIVRVELEEYQ